MMEFPMQSFQVGYDRTKNGKCIADIFTGSEMLSYSETPDVAQKLANKLNKYNIPRAADATSKWEVYEINVR